MLKYNRVFLCYLIICLFLVFNTFKTNAQSVFFSTKFEYSPAQLSKFLSSISTDENQVYFIANAYTLYCYNKNTIQLNFKKEAGSKTDSKPHLYKNTIITGIYEDGKHKCAFMNKTTGTTEQILTIPPLKTEPIFINDSIFIATSMDEEGGQLVS